MPIAAVILDMFSIVLKLDIFGERYSFGSCGRLSLAVQARGSAHTPCYFTPLSYLNTVHQLVALIFLNLIAESVRSRAS